MSGWEKVDANLIQKTNAEFEFLMPNKSNPGLFYIVNPAIGTCTCPVGISGLSGGPCKHQGAVAIKFHIAMLNFIPSLTLNDCMMLHLVSEKVLYLIFYEHY